MLGPIEADATSGTRFRNHPDLTAGIEDEGKGKMMRLLNNRTRSRNGPVAADTRHRYAASLRSELKLLDENESFAVATIGERIGVIATPVIPANAATAVPVVPAT